MDPIICVVLVIVAIVVGAALGLLFANKNANGKLNQAKNEASSLISDAHKQAETIKKEAVLGAKEEVLQIRNDLDKECFIIITFCI